MCTIRSRQSSVSRACCAVVFTTLVLAVSAGWTAVAEAELRRMEVVWQEGFENGIDRTWQLEHYARGDRLEVVQNAVGKSAACEGTHYLLGKSLCTDPGAGYRAQSPTYAQMGVDPREPYQLRFAYMIEADDRACWTYALSSRHASLVVYECVPGSGVAVIGLERGLAQGFERLAAITTGEWHQIDIVVMPHVRHDTADLWIRIDGVLHGNLEDWPSRPMRERLVMQDLAYRPVEIGNPPLQPGCFGAGNWDDLAIAVQVPETLVPSRALYMSLGPSPFNPRTELSFSLPSAERVSVDVFDVAGRRVNGLFEGRLAAGPHSIAWDGRDMRGADVSSGLYLFRVTIGNTVQTVRGTLVR